MFKLFKKSIEIMAPVDGEVLPIEVVPDEVFASKMLGDGVAFEYETDTVYAPCDGEIIMIAVSKHAIGIRTKNDAELMIHIGLETVNFNGEGFELLVASGEKVKQGQPIVKLDRVFFNKQKVNMITPMVVTSKGYEIQIHAIGEVDRKKSVMRIT